MVPRKEYCLPSLTVRDGRLFCFSFAVTAVQISSKASMSVNLERKKTMKNYQKYTRCYFMPPERCMDWAEKEYVTKAPIWCSVDLRDGNQSLIVPMSLEE